MNDEPNNHREDTQDDPILENHDNTEEIDDIGPAVGSLDMLQPTIDPNITPDLDSDKDEEFAGELTADDVDDDLDEDAPEDGAFRSAVGWTAIILAAVSFFIMPIIFGAAGIIVGFFARSRDAKTLGTVAIIAGAAAILISFFVRPYV